MRNIFFSGVVRFRLGLRVSRVEGTVMRENRKVRLVRKRELQTGNEGSKGTAPLVRPEPSEREIRTVVSRWVRDHRQRSEEFRRTVAALFQAGEFHLPTR